MIVQYYVYYMHYTIRVLHVAVAIWVVMNTKLLDDSVDPETPESELTMQT